MNPALPRLVFLIGAPALLAGLSGCATSGGADAPSAGDTPGATGYAWHDPAFYEPWHDLASVALPPPPFTGFSPTGQPSPMLPGRPRPPAGP